MTNTITFTIDRDVFTYTRGVADELGVVGFENHTTAPMKVKHRLYVTIDRDTLETFLDVARKNRYLSTYAEIYRALYGHYPQRIPR